jgi:hypothetical protein
MELNSDFKSFYEALEESLQQRKILFNADQLFQKIRESQLYDEQTFGNIQIMVSSWEEFLHKLFASSSTESLVVHLNNHLSFLRRLDKSQLYLHQSYLKKICEILFNYILVEKLLVSSHLELAEEHRSYEFNLYLFDPTLELTELIFYILSRDNKELNSTTEEHIRKLLISFSQSDIKEFKNHINQLKAIQETIHTILQLDRKEQPNSMIRQLKKEFDMINEFYWLLRLIIEQKSFENFNLDDLEFRTSYDYPFLDALKNLSRWYQLGDIKYLENTGEIIAFIETKNPFREEDIRFFDITKLLYTLTLEYDYLKSTEFDFPFNFFFNFLKKPSNNWYLKLYILAFLKNISEYPQKYNELIEHCAEFLLRICINPTTTLIYRKKIFNSITPIIQQLTKAKVIDTRRVGKYLFVLKKISSRLQKQLLKRMGNFKNISYRLSLNFHLIELEKGFSTQILFGLEDFSEWVEGKDLRNMLMNSDLKDNVRFQLVDNLFKIANEISEYQETDDKGEDLENIKSEMIMSFFSKVICEYYPLLPELYIIVYSAIIMHIINLAYDAEKISGEDRNDLIEKLKESVQKKSMLKKLHLIDYSLDELFSESYEKDISSVINLFHLYLPIYHI